MCKILTLTNAKKLNLKKITELGNFLLSIERDGFGYAIQGASGVFGEKCAAKKFESRIFDRGVTLPIVEKTHDFFGAFSEPIGAAIFHGRTSTNDLGLLNCHPIVKNQNYLIHNGVVRDHGPNYEMTTTNDSEHVLHRFLEGIESVEKFLTGYYAFCAIDSRGLLHVVRDRTAPLVVAWSDTLDSFIFGTDERIIRGAAKILNAKISPIDLVSSDSYAIFRGNEMLHSQNIKSLGYSWEESKHAEKSLGVTLEPMSDDDDLDDFLHELDCLDDSYSIADSHGRFLTPEQFYQLDYISQELCTITRADGTLVEIEPDYRKEA